MAINDMTIYLTEECNFKCSYCYYKKDYKSTLRIEDIESYLTFYFEKVADKTKKIYITLLGGEPLLKKDLLYKTIELINESVKIQNLNLKIILFVNGSLLLKEDVLYFLEKNVDLYISLDGIRESNDVYRKFRGSKESTFNCIEKRLKDLPREVIEKIGVNMVIGPENCKFLMKNIIFLQELNLKSIDINLMSYAKWTKESLDTLMLQLNELYVFYQELFSPTSERKPFVMYQLRNLFNKKGWGHMDDCHRIKLGPDNRIYLCDAFFSASGEKRKEYCIEREKIFFEAKRLKEEASENLKKIFPKTYLFHKENKLMYCPYGVYYYCKINNVNLEELLKNFYLFSIIFSSFLKNLFNKLKNNSKFLEFYRENEG